MHNYEQPTTEFDQLRGIIKNLIQDNDEFVRTHEPAYFDPFEASQHPRATVVACADARIHTQALDKTPDGDLFMIRNIGNQIATAEGSVEYGVRHLHTPLLIIVGHVACGAIKAAASNYSSESDAIKHELNSIQLPIKTDELTTDDWLRGVIANVNNQVNYALIKFADEVKEQILTVVGAVYDFQNVLGQGQGRLVIVNINGNIDTMHIAARLLELR
ncbi:MAG: carbonic anhydrase [Methylotenera sp.]